MPVLDTMASVLVNLVELAARLKRVLSSRVAAGARLDSSEAQSAVVFEGAALRTTSPTLWITLEVLSVRSRFVASLAQLDL